MKYDSRGCQVTEYRCLKTSRTDRLELDREASALPASAGGLQRETAAGRKTVWNNNNRISRCLFAIGRMFRTCK